MNRDTLSGDTLNRDGMDTRGENRTFAFCGGGTGGHIFPALAVEEALRLRQPQARRIYFGKADGMERDLVLRRPDLTFFGLKLSGFSRSFAVARNTRAVWQAAAGFWEARRILKAQRVEAILGTGGFVCGPVILAAASLGIPSVIHESNFIPGLTNRWLGAWVKAVAVSHEQTRDYFSSGKVHWTGFPLRARLSEPDRPQGRAQFGLKDQGRVLFVFPGSLAARRINQAVAKMLPGFMKKNRDWQVLWMTGEAEFDAAGQAAAAFGGRVQVRKFIHEVPEAYAAADLVLARAGAGTIAELSATGKPSLLIPYPHAAADHQTHNAVILHKAGSAEVMADAQVDGPALAAKLQALIKRIPAMTACAEVLRAVYPKNAAGQLAEMMIAFAARRDGCHPPLQHN